MRLADIAEKIGLEIAVAGKGLATEVTGGYCSDLLSDVMANAKEGNVWITLQTHQNIVAVGSLTAVAGVIITGGARPDQDTLARAESEGVTLLLTTMPSFEVAGRIHSLVCRG